MEIEVAPFEIPAIMWVARIKDGGHFVFREESDGRVYFHYLYHLVGWMPLTDDLKHACNVYWESRKIFLADKPEWSAVRDNHDSSNEPVDVTQSVGDIYAPYTWTKAGQ